MADIVQVATELCQTWSNAAMNPDGHAMTLAFCSTKGKHDMPFYRLDMSIWFLRARSCLPELGEFELLP
jgi:hypothetical protein